MALIFFSHFFLLFTVTLYLLYLSFVCTSCLIVLYVRINTEYIIYVHRRFAQAMIDLLCLAYIFRFDRTQRYWCLPGKWFRYKLTIEESNMIWSKIVANFNISNTRSNRPSSVFFDILGVILAASHWSYQGYLKSLREQILDFLLESWRRHQMETFLALLVPGEFPTQRPVTRSFDVFFDLRPNKRLSTQSWGWWSETPSHSFWRHSYASRMRHVTLETMDGGY